MIDSYLAAAKPKEVPGDIFALISPHAGYEFSGRIAAFGYKLIQGKHYTTVVVLGVSHHKPFRGAAVYPDGAMCTPQGDVPVDSAFAQQLLDKDPDIFAGPGAFDGEHSVEVQLPFLQKTLVGFKVVPVIMGDNDLAACEKLGALIAGAVGARKDVLVVASSDMYHGYDYDEADAVDAVTLSYLSKMDDTGLYEALRNGTAQLCGGFPVVTAMLAAHKLGHDKLFMLAHTNSAVATGNKKKGVWTVGYTSCAIDREGGKDMLNKEQKKQLLTLARRSIETYLSTGKKLEVSESDQLLQTEMGAFVTLSEHGQLRGCIGNMVGRQPLYLTIRDMAVEASTGDPRFAQVKLPELKDISIEISVLSPLERVDSPDKIVMGTHGVMVRQGFRSGVFLPQVAQETGWSKEEFLSTLCTQKAGLPADAWKDKSTELYVYTAEVFSEKDF